MKTDYTSNRSFAMGNATKRFVLPIIAAFLLFSCDSFVEVDLPSDQLFAAGVFEEPTTAHAAMVELYTKIRNKGLLAGSVDGAPFSLANYTDEMDYYGPAHLGIPAFYNNALTAANTDVQSMWNNTYNQIYGVNAVLEGVAKSKGLPTEVKNQLTGEALFLRGYLHFTLANVFGPVPYVTSTDYQINKKLARNPVEDVFSLAKADAEHAMELLPDTYTTDNRTRPIRYTAAALLARITLYQGAWEEAANFASAVLNQTELYTEASDLSQVFLKNSPTTIWQLSPPTPNSNTLEAVTFIFTSGPPPLSAVSQDLVVAFEPNDLRKTTWLQSVTDGTNTWYHPSKYKEGKNATTAKECSILFRTAELYLIRAEARARTGNLTAAKDDLNTIRLKAGLPPTTATTQEALLQAIWKERRVELFTEGGHRFFDLKRYGLLDNVLSVVKPGWNTTDQWFPIPETELSLNPQLEPQNPGY